MQTLLERDQQLNQLGEFGLDPSLVLYLPLWKKDGSSFMSDDAYGHLATVTGATWGSQGRTFDGVDDLIEANTVTTGGLFGGAHTHIAWAKLTAWANNRNIFNAGKTSATNWFSGIDFLAADKLFYARTRTELGTANNVGSLLSYNNDSAFHFFAMTVDADGKITDFSIDGVSQGSATTNTHDLSSIDKYYVGQLPWTSANINVWKGNIGEVRIYNRALTPFEIWNIYLATKWRYK